MLQGKRFESNVTDNKVEISGLTITTFNFGYLKEVRISGVLGVKFNHVYFFVNTYCVGYELIKIIQENCLKIRSIFLCPSAKSSGVSPAYDLIVSRILTCIQKVCKKPQKFTQKYDLISSNSNLHSKGTQKNRNSRKNITLHQEYSLDMILKKSHSKEVNW